MSLRDPITHQSYQINAHNIQEIGPTQHTAEKLNNTNSVLLYNYMRLRPPIVLMIHFFNYVLTSKRFINDVDIYKKNNILFHSVRFVTSRCCVYERFSILRVHSSPHKQKLLLVGCCRLEVILCASTVFNSKAINQVARVD